MTSPQRSVRATLAGGMAPATVATATLAAAGLVVLVLTLVALPGSRGWGYDFEAYFGAALRLLASGSPYQPETLGGPFRPGPGGLYLYSPLPALLIVPLTWLGLGAATMVWAIAHVAALLGASLLLPVSPRVRLAVIGVGGLSLPAISDVTLGNVSLFVTALSMVAWRFADRPAAGATIALAMSMRPTLGVLLGWWALRRRWRPLAWALGSGVALVALSLPFVGVAGYLDYLAVLRNVTGVTGVAENVDLASSALALGLPGAVAQAALYAGYGVAIAAMLISLRRDRDTGFVVVAVASLLLSPLLWGHYLTQLLLPAALLAQRGQAWGLLLPLAGWGVLFGLGWLLPLAVVVATVAPLLVRPRGEAGRRI